MSESPAFNLGGDYEEDLEHGESPKLLQSGKQIAKYLGLAHLTPDDYRALLADYERGRTSYH